MIDLSKLTQEEKDELLRNGTEEEQNAVMDEWRKKSARNGCLKVKKNESKSAMKNSFFIRKILNGYRNQEKQIYKIKLTTLKT